MHLFCGGEKAGVRENYLGNSIFKKCLSVCAHTHNTEDTRAYIDQPTRVSEMTKPCRVRGGWSTP